MSIRKDLAVDLSCGDRAAGVMRVRYNVSNDAGNQHSVVPDERVNLSEFCREVE